MGRRDPHTLYVLEMEPVKDPHAKWYVGITEDYERRLEQHKTGNGAAQWTHRNEVIDAYAIGDAKNRSSAEKFEKNLTKILAKEYGWETTRGGYAKRKPKNSTSNGIQFGASLGPKSTPTDH